MQEKNSENHRRGGGRIYRLQKPGIGGTISDVSEKDDRTIRFHVYGPAEADVELDLVFFIKFCIALVVVCFIIAALTA